MPMSGMRHLMGQKGGKLGFVIHPCEDTGMNVYHSIGIGEGI